MKRERAPFGRIYRVWYGVEPPLWHGFITVRHTLQLDFDSSNSPVIVLSSAVWNVCGWLKRCLFAFVSFLALVFTPYCLSLFWGFVLLLSLLLLLSSSQKWFASFWSPIKTPVLLRIHPRQTDLGSLYPSFAVMFSLSNEYWWMMCKKGWQIFANLIHTPVVPLPLKYSKITKQRYLHCLTLLYFLINLSIFSTVCLMLIYIQFFGGFFIVCCSDWKKI